MMSATLVNVTVYCTTWQTVWWLDTLWQVDTGHFIPGIHVCHQDGMLLLCVLPRQYFWHVCHQDNTFGMWVTKTTPLACESPRQHFWHLCHRHNTFSTCVTETTILACVSQRHNTFGMCITETIVLACVSQRQYLWYVHYQDNTFGMCVTETILLACIYLFIHVVAEQWQSSLLYQSDTHVSYCKWSPVYMKSSIPFVESDRNLVLKLHLKTAFICIPEMSICTIKTWRPCLYDSNKFLFWMIVIIACFV